MAWLPLVCLLCLLADDLAVVTGLSANVALRAVYARERAIAEWRSER